MIKRSGQRCRVCGCTEREPCNSCCGRVVDLCTTCAEAARALAVWKENARHPNMAALLREVDRVEKATTAELQLAALTRWGRL